MMSIVTVKIDGLQELQARFHKLRDDVQKKGAMQAVGGASKVTMEQAKRNVVANQSVRSGAMLNAIGTRRMTRASHPGLEMWAVGVFKGMTVKTYVPSAKNFRKMRAMKTYDVEGPAYYWKFVELGTVKMDAKPFLRPAMREKQADARDVMIEKLRVWIERAGA